MTRETRGALRRQTASVTGDIRRRVQRMPEARQPEFVLSGMVQAVAPVTNDGTYPHRDIGEVVVEVGDIGVVRERWSFLGENYYTVEFPVRAALVIMRGREMVRIFP